MSIDQLLTERASRKIPHWKRRKVKSPQAEFRFDAEAFRLIQETAPAPPPEPIEPERAPELFEIVRQAVAAAPEPIAPRPAPALLPILPPAI